MVRSCRRKNQSKLREVRFDTFVEPWTRHDLSSRWPEETTARRTVRGVQGHWHEQIQCGSLGPECDDDLEVGWWFEVRGRQLRVGSLFPPRYNILVFPNDRCPRKLLGWHLAAICISREEHVRFVRSGQFVGVGVVDVRVRELLGVVGARGCW